MLDTVEAVYCFLNMQMFQDFVTILSLEVVSQVGDLIVIHSEAYGDIGYRLETNGEVCGYVLGEEA